MGAMTKGAIAETLAAELDEEDSLLKANRQSRCHCNKRSEDCRKVCDSWCLHDQDSGKACEEGRQTHGFWQGSDGEGSAGQDSGKGFSSFRIEKKHLISTRACSACLFGTLLDVVILRSE